MCTSQYCEVHHEHFNDAWLQTAGEGEYTQPDAVVSRDTPTGLTSGYQKCFDAIFSE